LANLAGAFRSGLANGSTPVLGLGSCVRSFLRSSRSGRRPRMATHEGRQRLTWLTDCLSTSALPPFVNVVQGAYYSNSGHRTRLTIPPIWRRSWATGTSETGPRRALRTASARFKRTWTQHNPILRSACWLRDGRSASHGVAVRVTATHCHNECC